MRRPGKSPGENLRGISPAEGALHRAMDEDAIRWETEKSEFWAVVVAPWVLVQEIKGVSRATAAG